MASLLKTQSPKLNGSRHFGSHSKKGFWSRSQRHYLSVLSNGQDIKPVVPRLMK